MNLFSTGIRRIRPAVESLEDRQLLAVGALDPTFSLVGKTNFGFGPGTDDAAEQSALHTNGTILVVGTSDATEGGVGGFALSRLNPDGSLDTTGFGSGDGRVVTEFGAEAWGHAVAVQPIDGKILVAGRVFTSGSDWALGIARYLPNGTPDTSFGAPISPGRIVFDPTPDNDIPVGIAVRSDGKIIVGGTLRNEPDTGSTFGAARLLPNGSIDTSFGVGGYVGLNFTVNTGLPGFAVEATDLKLDANENILVSGSLYVASANPRTYLDVVVARFKADGSGLDQTFNSNGLQKGVATDGFSSIEDRAGRMTVQADGKVLVSAASLGSQGNSFLSLFRFNANGTHDTSFDDDGKLQLQPPGAFVAVSLNSTAVDTLGSGNSLRIAAAATRRLGNESDLFVARLLDDGSPDTDFSGDGMQTISVQTGGGDRVADVLIQGDGKIVVSGTTNDVADQSTNFAVARLENDSITFGAPKYTIAENGGAATITLTRVRGTTGTVSVRVTSHPGTATPGVDYTAISQIVTFGPGVTTRTVTVPIHADAVVEGVETVMLVLSEGNGANLSLTTLVPLEIQNVSALDLATPRPREIAAVLARVKRKGKTRTFVRVLWADTGAIKEEFVCPFQTPQYRGVAVRTLDADGDSAADTVVVVGKRGKRSLERRYRLS